ncbi:MAG: OadG family protein [Synergistaceae bacterium]|jgi:Na+-transporting methylmalonyl-CoA/oxaloacetate decarboxylase gamma subunit|nr:OadG family protein [Synergistaceae bacterium]
MQTAAAAAKFVDFGTAAIYSLIAFSIVFIVLFGLTCVIYAMRFVTTGSGGAGSAGSGPKQQAAPSAPAPAASGNAHVAAITAAVLAATHGLGRILSISPLIAGGRTILSEANRMWRSTSHVENVNGGIAPVWKR